MNLLVKPTPNERYFALGPKDAAKVAMQVARDYSLDGRPDPDVFREYLSSHTKRYRGKQLTLTESR